MQKYEQRLELTLEGNKKFVIEVRRCKDTNEQLVVTYMLNQDEVKLLDETIPPGTCKSLTITCSGGTITKNCKYGSELMGCDQRGKPFLTCTEC